MLIKCDYCNVEIEKKVSQIKRVKHHFCSKSCFYKFREINDKGKFKGSDNPNWKGGLVKVKCTFCEKIIERKKKDTKNRINLFCSKECASKFRKGKENIKISLTRKKLFKEGKLPFFIGAKGSDNIMFGKKHTLETRKRISEASKGHKFLEGTKLKMKKSAKNRYDLGLMPKNIGAFNEKNSAWKGGISFEPYTIDFNKHFKNLIRERDDHKCVLCQKVQSQLKYKLDVHHIDYNKKNTTRFNCVSLCRNCHGLTTTNRAQWTIFFQSLLKKTYKYSYAMKQEELSIYNGEKIEQ